MNYPGGKGNCFRHLVNLMPLHHTYIETHLGGGNVLERKRPAARNVGIDVDAGVIAAWSDRGLSLPLELHCKDAVKFLKTFPFDGGELVYADPPYLLSTKSGPVYRYEYTDEQHAELLTVLRDLPCAVIVSGYWSSLYASMLAGWRCVRFPNKTRQGRVIECAWLNYEPPAQFHDVRYVGADFRERERIKRKRNRWRARLAAMGPGERQFIIEALLELESSKTAIVATKEKNGRVSPRLSNDLDPTRYPSTPLFGDGVPGSYRRPRRADPVSPDVSMPTSASPGTSIAAIVPGPIAAPDDRRRRPRSPPPAISDRA